MSQAVESLLEAVQERRLPWFLSPPGPHHYDGPYMVLDFETTNAEKGSPILRENSVVAVAWYVQGEDSIQYERGNEFNLPAFSAALQQHQAQRGHLVGHNIKFDLQWLARGGYDLHHYLVYDTMLGEYVLDGNISRPRNLDAVAKRYGRVGKASHVDNMMRAGVCPSEMPHDYLRARAIRDVKDTLHIYLAQKRKLTERRQLAVQYTRCLLTPVLAHMELQGLRLDKARVQQEYDRAVAEYNAALLEFNELTGGVNPRSPAQMAKLIYDTLGFSELTNKGGFPIRGKASKAFPLGAPKTDQKTLDKLRATTAQQKRFLELRAKVGKLNAQLTKTLTFFKKVVDERGGIFYGQYNQAVTATHRLSSSGRRITFADGTTGSLQFQNMPNAFKDLIRAKQDGWLVGDHDGSQLEFRVAAFLGNDAKAKANIRADVDQHTFTAAQMLNKPESEVTKEERRLAKPDCFPLHTQYLTPAGWKYVTELRVGDEVIAYDQARDSLVVDRVLATVEPFYKEVIELRNSHWRFQCTPDHRWFGEKRRDGGVAGRYWERGEVRARDITKEWRITTTAAYEGGGAAVSPEDAARIAWIETDGCWRRDGRAVVIQKKPSGVQDIERLFGPASGPHTTPGCFVWRIPRAEATRLRELVGASWQEWVLSLSPAARESFLGATCLAEGTRREHGQWRIAQNSGDFCEAIKLCAFLCGYDVRTCKVALRTGKQHEQITLRTRRYVTGQRLEKVAVGKHKVACVTTRSGGCVVRQGEVITASHQTFKPLYGGQRGTKAQERYYAAFRREFAALAETQKSWTYTVLESDKLRTPWGMEFHFPGTRMRDDGYIDNTPSIYNYPIQSLATAEIIPIALVYLWHRLYVNHARSVIVNTVHDSVVGEVAPDEQELWLALGLLCFTLDVYEYLRLVYDLDFDVPLGVGSGLAERWEAPGGFERELNVEPDGTYWIKGDRAK